MSTKQQSLDVPQPGSAEYYCHEQFDPNYKYTDYSYVKDPRFMIGAADSYHRVGSDVNTIERAYGTVSQKRQYPKLADYLANR